MLVPILKFLLSTYYAFSCQKCRPLGLVAAYKKATHVVIATPQSDSPRFDDRTNEILGDNFVVLKIDSNIKGSIPETMINVQSYYGSCTYGLILPDRQTRLIFLRKENESYETLECKPPEMPIRNGKVKVRNKEIAVENLTEHFESILKRIEEENFELDLEEFEEKF